MRKGYSQPRYVSWWKWSILSLILLLFVCFIYGMFLYQNTQKNKTAGMAGSKEKVLQDTEIIMIDSMERFNGENSYHIAFGKNKDEQKKIAFIPLKNENKDIVLIDEADIMSKELVKNQWQEQCIKCKLIKITPGIVEDNELWELTYVDESNLYIIDYISMYDGTPYEQFRFTKMFK